jgi:hypothetical protein
MIRKRSEFVVFSFICLPSEGSEFVSTLESVMNMREYEIERYNKHTQTHTKKREEKNMIK